MLLRLIVPLVLKFFGRKREEMGGEDVDCGDGAGI